MKLDVGFVLAFLLASTGGAYIWTESVIGRPARIAFALYAPAPLNELAYCARCSAFWIGATLMIALVLGMPPIVLLPLSAVGVARILWGGLLEAEPTLANDAESLRRNTDNGRSAQSDEPSAQGGDAADESEAARTPEGKREEGAVRTAADGEGDGRAECGATAAAAATVTAIVFDGVTGCSGRSRIGGHARFFDADCDCHFCTARRGEPSAQGG